MIFLDIIIALFLIWGAYKGYQNGFVVQSFTLIALVFGVWAAIEFSRVASIFLINWFSLNNTLAFIIAFAVIFILVLVVVHLFGKLITNLLSKSVLGTLNRVGGVCFGIIKIAFIISIIIFILQRLDVHKKTFSSAKTKDAKVYTLVAKIAPAVFTHMHLVEIKNHLLKI
jgi:membrane protein required for colicin V production